MKMMEKIMLDCKQATFFSSIRSLKKLSWIQRIQLHLHLMVCKGCKKFDYQSKYIDHALTEIQQNTALQSDEILGEGKKSEIEHTIIQKLK